MYLDNGVGKVLLIHRIYWHNRIMLNLDMRWGFSTCLVKVCNLEKGTGNGVIIFWAIDIHLKNQYQYHSGQLLDETYWEHRLNLTALISFVNV